MTTNNRSALLLVLLSACGVSNPGGSDDQPPVFNPIDVTPKPPPCVDCAPVVTLSGSMLDERTDQIDYASGEPVHTHTGSATVLDGSGACPAIYKYGYLLDRQPLYGRETTQNPLAWQIAIASTSLDPSATAYRVRDDAGHTLLAWTPFDGKQIDLHRDGAEGIASLGIDAGTRYLDVRARDTQGRETIATSCWQHHPLAAPLRTDPPVQSLLFSWTLAADSPISELFTDFGVPVVGANTVQYTAEPMTVTFTADAPTGTYAKTVADRWVATSTQSASITCADTGDPACDTQPPANAPDEAASGNLTAAWYMRVADEHTGGTLCANVGLSVTCTLPPRAAGAEPHGYLVELGALEGLSLMARSGTQGEYTVAGRTYTGQPPTTMTKCSHVRPVTVNGTTYYACTQTTTYTHVVALASASVAFQPFALHLASSSTPQPSTHIYAFGPTPAWTWNAGTDVLPGQ